LSGFFQTNRYAHNTLGVFHPPPSPLHILSDDNKPTMASEAPASCVVCGEQAHNKCTGCKSDTASRHYCGKACQAKDWPAHKKTCKEIQDANLEKKLARVAEIVQQGFYDFRGNTWRWPIMSIDDRDHDVLTIHFCRSSKTSTAFQEFPKHLDTHDHTRQAVLCIWGCDEALTAMHDTLIGLVEGNLHLDSTRCQSADPSCRGMGIKLENVTVILGRIPRRILFRFPSGKTDDNSRYLHDIIRVTATKSKKQWFIDPSGAQYGIHQTFGSWESYENQFRTTIKVVQPIYGSKARLKAYALIPGPSSLSHVVLDRVMEHLDETVKKWKADRAMSLADLINMEHEEYHQASLELLQIMKDAVYTYKMGHDFKAEIQAARLFELRYPGRSKLIGEMTHAFFDRIAITG
jgi:hypothetical protein